MSVRRRAGSPWFWYDFTVQGHRFRGSCETNDKELAKGIEAQLRAEYLKQAITGRRPDMTLDEAFAKYWLQVAHGQSSAGDTQKGLERLLEKLGKGSLLSEVTDAKLADYVAWRREQPARRRKRPVSNATVNRDVELLRRVLRRADDMWKVAVEMPAWGKHLLPEADERNVTLGQEAVDRFFAALRPDYHELFRAALSSGVRLGNLISLRPAQVRWDEGCVVFRVKSKKPGGREVRVPIAGEFAGVLQAATARGSERVFTYLVRRSFRDRHRGPSGLKHARGDRLPFTQSGWRAEFKRAKEAAGLPWLRFHDLRHAYGNAIYEATHNLKVVQRALGHSDISSTMRYLRSDIDDVRAGMEKMLHSRIKVLPADPQAIDEAKKKA